MQSQLLTANKVKDLLEVDRSTVYRMAGDGRLPAVRVGRQWRFKVDEIDRLLGTGPNRQLQPLLDLAAELLGVMMVVTDMGGRPLAEVANPCPWFIEHSQDPVVIAACGAEWANWAAEVDLTIRFRTGELGFECARAFVRAGDELVGMVLAGGLASEGSSGEGLYQSDPESRRRVLDVLPRLAALFSDLIGDSFARRQT